MAWSSTIALFALSCGVASQLAKPYVGLDDQGNLHVNSTATTKVFIDGVDILERFAYLEALCTPTASPSSAPTKLPTSSAPTAIPTSSPTPGRRLVARIGTSSRWQWTFAGWHTAGQLFDDGDCLTTASSECKLGGWDTVPVDRFVLETPDYSLTVTPSVSVPSLEGRTMQEIFAYFSSNADTIVVPFSQITVTNEDAFSWIGETTRWNICQGGTGAAITELLQSTSPQDHTFLFNYHYEYQPGASQYGGSHPRGRAWIGVGNSGSNSHLATQTSNCIAGFGVDTRGPDDPQTGYATPWNAAGTTFVRPSGGYSTVAVYVWS